MNNQHPPVDTVTLFIGNMGLGGAERVFATLSRILVQRGYRVELILAHNSGPLLDELDPSVQIIDLNAYRVGEPDWKFGLRTVLKLAKYLRDHSPQVMLTTLTGTNLVSIMARGLSRRRFRLVIREAAALNNVKSTVRKWLMRWLYPSADQIVALTEHMKEQMFNELKIPRHRVTVIGNPLDFERIDVLAKDKRELQYIRSLKPYIVAIGRLAEPKDFYTLIRARGKLPPTAPNLVIIGDGPQRTALESIVQELDLKDCVHLLGFRSNPYPWLRAAQGFMLSSRWEGYPNVLLEALHFGLPIVATEYDCSLRTLLRSLNSDCYRLVPVGDVDALAEAILKFLEYSKGVRIRGCPGDYTDRLIERYESVLDIPKDKNN